MDVLQLIYYHGGAVLMSMWVEIGQLKRRVVQRGAWTPTGLFGSFKQAGFNTHF